MEKRLPHPSDAAAAAQDLHGTVSVQLSITKRLATMENRIHEMGVEFATYKRDTQAKIAMLIEIIKSGKPAEIELARYSNSFEQAPATTRFLPEKMKQATGLQRSFIVNEPIRINDSPIQDGISVSLTKKKRPNDLEKIYELLQPKALPSAPETAANSFSRIYPACEQTWRSAPEVGQNRMDTEVKSQITLAEVGFCVRTVKKLELDKKTVFEMLHHHDVSFYNKFDTEKDILGNISSLGSSTRLLWFADDITDLGLRVKKIESNTNLRVEEKKRSEKIRELTSQEVGCNDRVLIESLPVIVSDPEMFSARLKVIYKGIQKADTQWMKVLIKD